MRGTAEITFLLGLGFMTACASTSTVHQLTTDPKNHCLDNNDNFSPDDRFLCYDTRPDDGAIVNSQTIEKVHLESGVGIVLYKARDVMRDVGPGLGAASYSPVADEVVFICGKSPSSGLGYEKSRRFGRLVAGDGTGRNLILDARDVTPPFTPGALRGGTHRHEPDGTGRWIGFTYNDQIMKAQDMDLRTIGVTERNHPVKVDKDALGENHDGEGWSVLVVRVTSDPRPGSDEISNAAGDSWVGTHGYKRPDGKLQRARAFVGRVRDRNGRDMDEVFIVDIPEDLTQPGPWGPLEGTEHTFPQPPAGTVQRRLTFTADKKYPGVTGIVRSSPDGSQLSFLMADAEDRQQVFLISPIGGEPRQASFEPEGVRFAPRWHPSVNSIVTVDQRNRVLVIGVASGETFGKSVALTDGSGEKRENLVWSHDGRTIAFNQRCPEPVEGRVPASNKQIFLVTFPDRNRNGIPDPVE